MSCGHQVLNCAAAGNIQAMVEVGSLYFWGNRTLVPDACLNSLMPTGVQGAADWLLRARGDTGTIVSTSDRSKDTAIMQTRYLAHEYLVLIHLAGFIMTPPLFESSAVALKSLTVITHISAGVTSIADRVISRAVLGYALLSGRGLPYDCGYAQSLLAQLAQATVMNTEATAAFATDDVALWNTWEDMVGLQQLQEQDQVVDYLR